MPYLRFVLIMTICLVLNLYLTQAINSGLLMKSYLETTKNLYGEAAIKPEVGLCCTTTQIWQFPELKIPKNMLDMNYGCGSTVNPRNLVNNPKTLCSNWEGMELLQFSYFSRKKGAIIGINPVDEMIGACTTNIN